MMHHDIRTIQTGRYSPLRYPGGKGKLATFVRQIIRENSLSDGHYVEPYAGGAAVAIELLLTEEVSRVSINDVSPQIFSFWHSLLHRTEELCKLVTDTLISVEEWDRQKQVLRQPENEDPLAIGFATFFLNRTNRSGILNAGIIGGREQKGEWKIDARYNARELEGRIKAIANLSARIQLSNLDAVDFLEKGGATWGARTLVYLDPPYYVKGKHLYHHFYRHSDHVEVCAALSHLQDQRWIVSYDAVPEIEEIYAATPWLKYSIGYSARAHMAGQEIMFFGPGVTAPEVVGSMQEIDRSA